MKIVAWNFRWGGGDRCGNIAAKLSDADPDVIVLSEYQPQASAPLVASLAEAGWRHQVLSAPPMKYGGAAIVSKTALTSRPLSESMRSFDHR